MSFIFFLFWAVFWVSVAALFYTYLEYVLLLWLVALVYSHPLRTHEDALPRVSLVVPAYNEVAVLERKLGNALATDYPSDRFDVALISDGSTEETNRILGEWAQRDHRVHCWISPVNEGKDASLMQYMPERSGDILIFSDANSFYPPARW